MNNPFKRILPIILVLAIIASIGWYLFVYDREFTRDMLLEQARFWDSQGHSKVASWFYDQAYSSLDQDEDIAIELANQYKYDGNYTKAEYTLTNAIADGGTAELYIALCKTYVEQDKLLDAVHMLDNISDSSIKAQLDVLRPSVPTVSVEPGLYSQYLPVTLSTDQGILYVSRDGEYPSTEDDLYTEAITLPGGETQLQALVVADNGLVSPLCILEYTVGSVIEEAIFTDTAVEAAVREMIGCEEDHTIMTDELWEITEFTVPDGAASIEDLKLFPYLQTLTVQNMHILTLEPIAGLSELTSLRLEECEIYASDLGIVASLPSLQRLTLSSCGLSTIADLAGAQKLTYLDVSHNTLRNLEVLEQMDTLYEINLSHNAVTDLTSLSVLPSLERLDVSYNSLTSLAPMARSSKLTWLNAGHNSLADLSGLDEFSSLTHLMVDHNLLSDVSVLEACTGLVELNISNNSVSDIRALSTLTALEDFDFSYNQISQLPSWPEGSALVSIDGSYNQISSLSALRNMENLSYVYMDYNLLESIDVIADCYRLVSVNVYGNDIDDVSKLKERNIIVNYDPS